MKKYSIAQEQRHSWCAVSWNTDRNQTQPTRVLLAVIWANSVRLTFDKSGFSVEDSTKILNHSMKNTFPGFIDDSVPGISLMIHLATLSGFGFYHESEYLKI